MPIDDVLEQSLYLFLGTRPTRFFDTAEVLPQMKLEFAPEIAKPQSEYLANSLDGVKAVIISTIAASLAGACGARTRRMASWTC